MLYLKMMTAHFKDYYSNTVKMNHIGVNTHRWMKGNAYLPSA